MYNQRVKDKVSYQCSYHYLTQYTARYHTMSAVNRPKFCKISRSKIVGRSTDHILNYKYVSINIFYIISAHLQHGSVDLYDTRWFKYDRD